MDIFEKINNDEYRNKLPWSSARAEYQAENRRLQEQFKRDLFEEFDVTNNPKAEQAYSLAWQYGHSSGYMEVASYFCDIVELIK